MEKIIVYLDDASHALRQIQPMLLSNGGTHWVLVACAPHLTRHASKWVDPRALESWRQEWAQPVFAAVLPLLQARGDTVDTVVAHGDLHAFTQTLQDSHGPARVLDARCPKFGQDLASITAEQGPDGNRWKLPLVLAGMGAALMLASD
ncbi:hypothetical protein [Rhodoferax sp.]|uniref:hypothetical protein n=1 Tax=Rhodoferax sp. TaxID=50421 RepID=UPI00374D4238